MHVKNFMKYTREKSAPKLIDLLPELKTNLCGVYIQLRGKDFSYFSGKRMPYRVCRDVFEKPSDNSETMEENHW